MKTTKIIATALFLSAIALNVNAQRAKDGGISSDMMKELSAKSIGKSQAETALHNAIMNNSIDVLAKGKAQLMEVPQEFSVSTPSQSIMDQKSSGRCWMFSGLNTLRANFALNNEGKAVEFSQDYLFFYDQLEKSNLFLQSVIDTGKKDFLNADVQFLFKNPINDGSTFCGVADLVEKYGLVPKCVMPESFSAENTSRMRAIIASKLREYGLKLRKMIAEGKKPAAVMSAKKDMLGSIYHILELTLGTPPTEFTYAHRDKDGKTVGEAKTYTPLSFAEECGAKELNGTFVMLMNDPRHEYYKLFEVELDRHTYDGHNWQYVNLPMEDIEAIAIQALKDGKKMYSSYDVGKLLDRTRGFCSLDNFDYASLFQTEFPMTKAERISTFDSGSTHAMTLTAVNLDADGKPTAWKVENSWGASHGQKGCLVMTADWFREYMFRLVVDKKYANEKILDVLKQKPSILTYDDPLFIDE